MNINILFPLEDDIKGKLFKLTEINKNAIKSDLMLLLLTKKGERYYDPEYGCDLLKYIFEPNDDITITDIKAELNYIVSKYLPKIIINDISFEDYDDNVNAISMIIKFTYKDDFFVEDGIINIKI